MALIAIVEKTTVNNISGTNIPPITLEPGWHKISGLKIERLPDDIQDAISLLYRNGINVQIQESFSWLSTQREK